MSDEKNEDSINEKKVHEMDTKIDANQDPNDNLGFDAKKKSNKDDGIDKTKIDNKNDKRTNNTIEEMINEYKITQKIDQHFFDQCKTGDSALLYLLRLVSVTSPNNIPSLIQISIEHSIFQTGRVYSTAIVILDNYYMSLGDKCYSERIKILESFLERFPQHIDMWLRLINTLKEKSDDDKIRNAYKKAMEIISIDKQQIVEEWMAFEAVRGNQNFQEIYNIVYDDLIREEMALRNEKADEFGKKTVFVSGLNASTKPDTLSRYFAKAGEVVRVSLKTGFAFVEFSSVENASKAISLFDGTFLDGSKISVVPDKPKTRHTLFIRYNPTADDFSLIDFLKKETGITKIKYRLANQSNADKQRTGLTRKGHGFLDVESEDDALKLIRLTGKKFMGQSLSIEVARHNANEAHQHRKSTIKSV